MDVIVFTLAAVHTVSYCPMGNLKQTTKIRVDYCDEHYSNMQRQAHLSSNPEGKNRQSKGHTLCFLSTMELSYYLELIPFNSIESKL